MYIVPTDDTRLKLVLIPFIVDKISLIEQVKAAISKIQCELTDYRELLVPSFSVTEIQLDQIVGF